jgi:uncharacterized protein YndB with AHSA1/START domain
MTLLRIALAAGLVSLVQTTPGRAVVSNVAANGFTVTLEAAVAAPRDRVYRALVGNVGAWWSSDHTFSGDSKNLSIEARPGGCFCERLPDGGGVEHLRVVFVKPGEMLRLTGALGPLQPSALAGSMTWTLMPAGSGTNVTLSYAVGGFRDGGFADIAPAVDGVLSEQLQRLKRFVETGKPTA